MACCDILDHHTKQKHLCSGYFYFGMFCSLAPIVLGIYMITKGGTKWGGNLPENVILMYAMVIASGVLAFICTARVIYQLLFNRHYDGRKGSIRSQILIALTYLGVGVFGYLSLSNYADSPACSNRNLLDLWDETVFNEGTQAYKNFCNTCQCLISNKDLTAYTPLLLHSLNYSTKQGATSIAECDAREGQLNTVSFGKLQAMEENFACAGFCSPNPTFTFIGTLNGKPTSTNGCLAEVSLDFDSYRTVMIILASFLSVYSIGGYFVGMQLRLAKLKEGLEKCGIESFHTRMISANSAMGGHEDLKIEDFHSTSDFGGAYLVENNYKMDISDNQRQVSANFKEIDSERDLMKYKHLEKIKQAFRSMNTPRGTFRMK